MTRSNSSAESHLLRNETGTVLLEATLVLPFLLLFAIGAFEFGRILQHHHVVVKAVRDAGRYLARVPAKCPAGAIANAANETTAINLAMTGVAAGGSPRLSYWTNPATVSISVTCFDNTAGAYYGRPYIPLVTVTATVPYGDVGFLEILGFDPITFQLSHEEVNFGE
jgi:Flp pilus assembly protein TadG